jgi:hypothetical protein
MRSANTRRSPRIPRRIDSARSDSTADALLCGSHRTLPSTFVSNRIQISKTPGVILNELLKEQKTNPSHGRPNSSRVTHVAHESQERLRTRATVSVGLPAATGTTMMHNLQLSVLCYLNVAEAAPSLVNPTNQASFSSTCASQKAV